MESHEMTECRQIKSDEWALLKQVRLEALKDSPDAFSTTLAQAEKHQDVYWKERSRNGAIGEKEFCALAINDRNPVGMAVGLTDEDNAARMYLVSMWVAPSFRGSDVASSLLNQVTLWARDRGGKSILLDVMPSNSRALEFYYKMGFEQHKDHKSDHPAFSGCELVLEKKLEEQK